MIPEQSSTPTPGGNQSSYGPVPPNPDPRIPPKDHYTLSADKLGAVSADPLPVIEVFQHIDFNHSTNDRALQGDPEGGWSFRTSFNIDFTGDTEDKNLSSFIVYSGKWQMYSGPNFTQPIGEPFGPGHYEKTANYGVPNDSVTSIKCVSVSQAANPVNGAVGPNSAEVNQLLTDFAYQQRELALQAALTRMQELHREFDSIQRDNNEVPKEYVDGMVAAMGKVEQEFAADSPLMRKVPISDIPKVS